MVRARQTWRDKKQYRILPSRAGIMDLLERAPAGLFLPPAPSAPYTAEPPIDAPRFDYNMEGYGRYSPIDLDLSPIDNVSRPAPTQPSTYAVDIPPPPTVTDITGLPVAAPETAPAPTEVDERRERWLKERIARRASYPPEKRESMAARDRAARKAYEQRRESIIGYEEMTPEERGDVLASGAPFMTPEEFNEKYWQAEISRTAGGGVSPLWSETTTPEYEATRREALGQQLATRGWHRFHGIRPPEHFAERRARRREKQLARGAPPTWPERAEHEMKLAELGRTYPKTTAPEPRTREDVWNELAALEEMKAQYAPFIGEDGKEYPGDPAQYEIYDDMTRAKQDELAVMEGGEVAPEPYEVTPAETGFFGGVTPAEIGERRRFKKVGQQKRLTPKIAVNFLRRANGDRELAQRMAAEEGYIE